MSYRHSDATKAKISAARMGQYPSPETRTKISMAGMGRISPNKGTTLSDEQKAKISVALMGRTASTETRAKESAAQKGRLVSIETRALISMALMGHVEPEETRAKKSASHMGPLNWRWYGGRKVTAAKSHAKRRTLGFTPLNSPFVGCEGHHIDNEHIIYIPYALHHSVYHRQSDGIGMDKINALAYEWLAKENENANGNGIVAK